VATDVLVVEGDVHPGTVSRSPGSHLISIIYEM
jgi:hypothetical protein